MPKVITMPHGAWGKDAADWPGTAEEWREAMNQAEEEAEAKAQIEGQAKASIVPARAALVATEDELAAARLTPKVIVDQLLYADVAQIVAPGATGKTTLLLYMALRIALGEPLFGQRVISPGATLIVTAEDQRERLLARLREIMARMPLTPEERAKVLASVLIWERRQSATDHPGGRHQRRLRGPTAFDHRLRPPGVIRGQRTGGE